MQQLCKPKVLILDEMGYLPLERQVATFLFQLVAKRLVD
jgi:DNA replication protein DnaC